jgi:hypothetical protein
MAILTAVQPFMDAFLFFVPFYYSLKLAFACYLWANNLRGTQHVYAEYASPFVRRYEPLVDFKLSQMKAVASQVVSSNASKAVQYLQVMMVKALSQGVAEAEGHGARRKMRARNDDDDSFKTAYSGEDGDHRAYFDRTRSPLRAGGSRRETL